MAAMSIIWRRCTASSIASARRSIPRARSSGAPSAGSRRCSLLLPLSHDGPDPAIALVGLVFRSAEPFPPALRALGDIATHRETRRFVLKSLAAPERALSERVESPGRVVA